MQSTFQENSLEYNDIDFIKKSSQKFESFFFVDEVGRGPLAGPVVSCALKVQRNQNLDKIHDLLLNSGIRDSKKLSTQKRKKILGKLGVKFQELRTGIVNSFWLEEYGKLDYCLGACSPKEIDEVNILNASLLSMKKAVDSFTKGNSESSGLVLADGNKSFKSRTNEVRTLIKGDSKSIFIALASIIAKEYRDHHMEKMSKTYPEYGFEKHSGYPTKLHREMITIYGPSAIHRTSFKLL